MPRASTTFQNFSGGETSDKIEGRYDLEIYKNSCRWLENFIAELQGPGRFRTGTIFVNNTRRNNVASLIPFQFNDEQAYEIEVTDGYMRFYKDQAIITEDSVAITGITNANPGVVTSASHGLANGDEVFLESVGGMTQVNGKSFIVANKAANTFELTDQDGNNVNTSAYGTYTSGGVFKKIVELVSPYREADDLFKIQYAGNTDVLYLVHPYYEPRKLTRTSHTSWTLSLFTRTADPFLSKKTISAATKANPCQVTATGHGYATGDIVIIEGVVGMTELNGRYYTITKVDDDNFTLDGVNSTAYTTYVSDGYASERNLLPGAVAFYESRLFYSAIPVTPLKVLGSRTPDSSGVVRYDDLTTGTDDDHAVQYTIGDDEAQYVYWLAASAKFLGAGALGKVFKITGATEDEAITPTSINVRPLESPGVANVIPIKKGNVVIYVSRDGLTLLSLEFDALADASISIDRNLVSDHITKSGIKQIAWQSSRPESLWGVKENGELLGLTFKSREDVSGWHRHKTRSGDSFTSVGVMPQITGKDEVWLVAERSIDGVTRRYVEYISAEADIPKKREFFTGEANEEEDTDRFLRAMFEAQKSYIHLDSALSYDGSSVGSDAGAGVTPAAVTGASVQFTASAAVFTAAMIGRQIWKKAIDGEGYGRAKIIEFTDPTHVTCQILEDFDSAGQMAAGDWFLTTDAVSGLDHLEGEEVSIVTDGAVHDEETVASGAVTLDYQASVVHVGLAYKGFLQPRDIEAGGALGPAQTKERNITQLGVRFLNTLGAKYGTDLYKLESLPFRNAEDYIGRPPALFSGVKSVPLFDSWEREKTVYIVQDKPLPCIVQLLSVTMETID